MTVHLSCNDAEAWTGGVSFDGLLYHTLVQSSAPVQSGMCYQSWQLGLLLSLVSLLLWSSVLALLGSMLVAQFDRERTQEIEKQRRDRLEYVLKVINIKQIQQSATTQMDLSNNVASGDEDSTRSTQGRRSLSSEICCICLEEFRVGDIICQSHTCSHVFHLDGCMKEWLMGHDECPICRRDYLSFSKQRSQALEQTLYVDPVSRILMPPMTYNVQYQQEPNQGDGFRRRASTGFAETSMFGFDDIPQWLVVP